MKKFYLVIVTVLLLSVIRFLPDILSRNTTESKIVELHITRQEEKFAVNDSTHSKGGIFKLPLKASRSICSGAFVSNDGLVLTAKHCTDGAKEIEVITSDDQSYAGKVVQQSVIQDLAAIRIDKKNTPYFRLASAVRRGEVVFALGSPLGLTNTLSTGIVAKLSGDMTLIDCSVLPGNSGCPLFNKNGELVGIVVAGFWVGFGTTHLNLAQSLDTVKCFLGELK